MNFATLQGLTIPEGVVTQITDAAGNVLWKAPPSGAKITIIGDGGNYANVVIDGVTYNTAAELVVEPGTVINCVTQNRPNYGASIFYNLERVVYRPNAQYSYTVTGDATIALGQYDVSAIGQMVCGHISIVDESAPSYATITIARNRPNTVMPSVTVNNTTYKVPILIHASIGSQIVCTPTSIEPSSDSPAIYGVVCVNGEVVATRDTYNYILAGDVNIEIIVNNANPFAGDIYITEL